MKFKICIIFLLFSFILFPSPVNAVTYDLNTTSNWNLRIDGATANDRLTRYSMKYADLNGNGKDDLLIAAAGTDYNSRNASGSIYILYDSLLDDYLTSGNTIDLNTSTSYNIRIDGPAANAGIFAVTPSDLNNDGNVDLVISGDLMDFNSRGDSGSVYVLYNSIFSGYAGTGNTIDLNNSSKYNLRIDGASAGDNLGSYSNAIDIDQNSKPDLLLNAYSRNSSEGSVYLIKDSIIDDYTTTGNTIDLATTSNFNVRWDGGSTGIYFGLGGETLSGDFDNDDKPDLLLQSIYLGNNSRSNSGSVFVVFNTLLDDNVGTGNIVNISTSSNYSVRIDGSEAEAYLEYDSAGKFDQSGNDNLILHQYASTGPMYVIANSKLLSYAGTTGNNVDLATSSNYNLAISGVAEDYPGVYDLRDYTNDGYNDIVIGAYASNNSRAYSGSAYFVSGSVLNGYMSSTGNTLSMASSSNYIFRLDGAVADHGIPYQYTSGDFNGDGINDIVISSQDSDYNSRNNSGSVWFMYSFTHTITATDTTVSTSDTTPTLTGSVAATNSRTTIANVQYRVDSSTPSATWTSCTASDGTFNSTSEAYTCTIAELSDGDHTVYFRAVDTNGFKTALASYDSVAVTVDTESPTYTNIQTQHVSDTSSSITYTTSEAASTQLEYGDSNTYGTTTTEADTSTRVTSHSVTLSGLTECTTYHYRLLGSDATSNEGSSDDGTFRTSGCISTSDSESSPSDHPQIQQGKSSDASGSFKPTEDSYTGSQNVTVIVEPGTFDNNAYFSSVLSTHDASTGMLSNPLSSVMTTSPFGIGNIVAAGGIGGKLGIKQACGIAWQVGGVQQMWYKTYPPKGSNKPAAIIIPELQHKPSIIALGYTSTDLTPPGQHNTTFDPARFKLAHSLDGAIWQVLPTSVVDTTNRTVAALHKVGGFYMIVAGCNGQQSFSSNKTVLGATAISNQDLDTVEAVSPTIEVTPKSVVKKFVSVPTKKVSFLDRIKEVLQKIF